MNSILSTNPWLHWLGALALEAGIVVGLAAALQIFLRAAAWRRTIWQTCLIGMLTLAIVEFTGGARWLATQTAASFSSGQTDANKNFASSAAQQTRSTELQLNQNFRREVAVRMAANQQPPTSTPDRFSSSDETTPVGSAPPITPILYENITLADPSSSLGEFNSFKWIGLVWVFGFGVVSARCLFGRLVFAAIRRRRQAECDVDLKHRVQVLARCVGIAHSVRVIQMRGLSGPIAFGWLRPTIALPCQFGDKFNATQQSAMLAHELAHLAAHDPAWNLAADLVTAAWWWHPLAWWSRREFRAACETAADEASLVVKDGPSALAECLVALGSRLSQPRAFGWLGVGGFRSGLGRRVEKLIYLRGRDWQQLGSMRAFLTKSFGPVALIVIAIGGVAWASPRSAREGEQAVKLMQAKWKKSFAALAIPSVTAADSPAAPTEKSNQDAAETAASNPEATPASTAPPATERDALARRYGIDPRMAARYGLVPTDSNTNALPLSKGRRVITSKLESIYFEELPQFDGVPLSEVVKFLRDEAVKRDPTQKGINFLVNSLGGVTSGRIAIDPNTGVPIQPSEPKDLGKVMIRLTFPLRSVRFKDALDVLMKVADSPIKYTIEDYAVVFTQGADSVNPAVSTPTAQLYHIDEALMKRYGLVSPPGTLRSGSTPVSKQAQAVQSKLEQIVIGETSAFDGLPLSEVIRYLHAEARKWDSEKHGINFVIAASSGGAVDPTTGVPLPAERIDLKDIRVRLPELSHVRLKDVLDAVVKVAERPLQYSVENYGVVVFAAADKTAEAAAEPEVPKAGPSPQLFTRTFRVDPNTVTTGLERAFGISFKAAPQDSPDTNRVQTALRELLAQLGLDMGRGGNVLYYNDSRGILMVRASMTDLETVEKAIEVLNTNPPQIVIEAKLVTLSDADAKALSMDWFSGNTLIDQATNKTASSSQTNLPINAALTTANGILTEPQFRVVLRALEQHGGVDVLAAPLVTTLSGRQAQISITERRSIVTGIESENEDNQADDGKKKSTEKKLTATLMDFGPTLDVVPYVAADGETIRVKVVCRVKEFLGYDEPPKSDNAQTVEPLPRIRTSEVESHSVLLDGQTLVLGGGLISEKVLTKDKVPVLGDIPLLGRLFRSESSSTSKKHLVVFLTPRIIDPAGNPVHSPDNLPFEPNPTPGTKRTAALPLAANPAPAIKRTVSVVGHVAKPGNYELPSGQRWTAVEAIAAAGGPAKTGNANRIEVTHNNSTATYRFDEIRKTTDPSKNPPLEPGDVVFVPERVF